MDLDICIGGKPNWLKPIIVQALEASGDSVIASEKKAGDRIRTGDVQLGKLAFYR